MKTLCGRPLFVQCTLDFADFSGFKTLSLQTMVHGNHCFQTLAGKDAQLRSHIVGPILMDSTYRNIKVLQKSIVEWTKSFAWESETDGVNVEGQPSPSGLQRLRRDVDSPKGPIRTKPTTIRI